MFYRILSLFLTFAFASYANPVFELWLPDDSNKECKYYLAVTSMFKDEAPWLKEWIEYNKLMGVQHFRLYNNDSSDNYLEVLEPYIKNGEVTLIDWPGGHGNWCSGVQGPAFLDAINHFKGVSKWLAIIDIDEFILPTEKPNMVSFLKEYESYGGIFINWLNYGTSGLQEIPPDKLMIEVLIMRANEYCWWNEQGKSIVRPECVNGSELSTFSPHQWNYLPGLYAVAPTKEPFVYTGIHVSQVRINHYVHRTEKYLYEQKLAKKARMEKGLDAGFVKSWHDDCNVIEDKAIFRLIPALRKKIFLETVIAE